MAPNIVTDDAVDQCSFEIIAIDVLLNKYNQNTIGTLNRIEPVEHRERC